jgi:hypothetical protein
MTDEERGSRCRFGMAMANLEGGEDQRKDAKLLSRRGI